MLEEVGNMMERELELIRSHSYLGYYILSSSQKVTKEHRMGEYLRLEASCFPPYLSFFFINLQQDPG